MYLVHIPRISAAGYDLVDVVFFTSNRTKLAHFKYLGRQLGLSIKGFREKSFYATYHEPQIEDRAELLHQSYQNALRQWTRLQQGSDEGFFLLEDTSVRIEALSTSNIDIPGVNIKFWMKGKTFADVNGAIGTGDRRATVRSDIILHIPENIRLAIGFKEKFLWVVGETGGHVVREERRLYSNVLYPWLDSRSFNRWFAPDGFAVPFSKLKIADANTVDFRLKALRQIADFLASIGFRAPVDSRHSSQLSIPTFPSPPPIVIVCGFSCAGKTTLASWLRENHDYLHVEASDFMYRAYWESHGLGGRVKIGDYAELALRDDPAIVANPIASYLNARRMPNVVVTGFRSPKEILALGGALGSDRKVEVVFVDASEEIRLQRAIARGRDRVTTKKFHERDSQELRMGLDDIRRVSTFTFKNEGTKAEFFREFQDRYGESIRQYSDVLSRRPVRLERELEARILTAMFLSHREDGAGEAYAYTTTEIAQVVNRRFGVRKSKNNVSRYFNQEYHPYFEVRSEGRKLRYRLSHTGMSEARLLLTAVDKLAERRHPTRSADRQRDLF